MPRQLEDWIETFYQYTEFLPSPPLFRRWGAIACIAGVLERKVWVHTQGSNLYPHLYTILVAPPGVGKSEVTSRVEELWRSQVDHHVASTSVSKASMMDDLKEAERTVINHRLQPSTQTFNSLKILSNELGVLLPAYENDFMSALTDIYDGKTYSERRRTRDIKFEITRPQINLLAATTPSYLNNLMPEGAWDQGFISRVLLIYSGERQLRDLFSGTKLDKEIYKKLQQDLKTIANLSGEILFTEEAKNAINTWHQEDGPPKPNHPKLIHYCTRRSVHLLKLCMIAAMSSGDKLLITIDHFHSALNWLIEAEHYMPDIFKAMSGSGDGKIMEECWFFIYQIYMKTKAPVPESKVFNFLAAKLPAHSVKNMIEVMLSAKLMTAIEVNKIGRCFKPAEKRGAE